MRTMLFWTALVSALVALLYLPGMVPWNWPGQTWALAGFAPLVAMIVFAALESAATAHDRTQN